jgi:BlaI family transcriptional regulator, penicillinase repressor
MPHPPKPTDSELVILRVLWTHGPSTVRQVHDILSAERTFAYTTSLKTMQIMLEKGLVTREDVARQHVYRAHYREQETQRRLVGDLLDRAFGGSVGKLVVQALASRRASAADLREIRRLLAEQTRKSREKESAP